jgi:hypothetical protein
MQTIPKCVLRQHAGTQHKREGLRDVPATFLLPLLFFVLPVLRSLGSGDARTTKDIADVCSLLVAVMRV